MAVNVGDIINAAQYNGLQSRVATIMGTGSGTEGYGQTLTSSQVLATATVTAEQMDNLRTDLNKATNHQLGSNANISDIAVGEIIGADATGASISTLTDTTGGFNDYDIATGVIESNKFSIDAGNSSVESTGNSSTRTTSWNGQVTHVFTVTFASANDRRHFFNSGGEIRFSANLSGQSGAKSDDWATLLSNMGTIKFNYTQTTSTGTGTGTSIGNYDVTGSYQQIFQKTGSGNYAENDYNIQVKENSATVLEFLIEFRDDDTGDPPITPVPKGGIAGGVDEDVNGTLSSVIQQLRATGSNVSVPTPAYSNTSNL
jgi:hypothetical protein|tara:strand:+ start:3820 stop:4764 length:945 start_codon:yes stop_codon:yes gene_type:complete